METQNSGLFCSFGTKIYACTSDNRPIYYGKLVDIIELNYYLSIHGAFI